MMAWIPDFLLPALLTLGFLLGLRWMRSPRTAVRGNRLGALCMALAVTQAFWRYGVFALPGAWTALGLGAALGWLLAHRVKSIRMPQLVALLNGFGGAASALVIAARIPAREPGAAGLAWLTAVAALTVGSLTFSGSLIAALKLQGYLASRPLRFAGQNQLLLSLGALGLILLLVATVTQQTGALLAIIALALIYGLLMALRVGGADMPVVISFLNSLSGIAAALSGIALGSPLAAGVGTLVGVAGMILTRLMCRAMNRNLAAVLSGFAMPESETEDEAGDEAGAVTRESAPADASQIPDLLQDARRVLIVPGYGMALAQAQQAVKDLMDALEAAGKEVKVAVHPVAGRMPGHMHVLLAEVGVGVEKLYDMAKINHEFAETDMVVAVGACDVMNPAATTAKGTPISGMPILRVAEARAVIVCNLDEKPGYSGVANTLYQEPHVITCWGDAAQTVPEITRRFTQRV